MGDSSDIVIPIIFRSSKSKRICRSTIATEFIPFSDLFNASFTLASELSTLTNRKVCLRHFTDSKYLFDIISKGSRTSAKRLMLDVGGSRQRFKMGDISNIGFVRCESNVADGFTNLMSQASLRNVLVSGMHIPTAYQWIIRQESDSVSYYTFSNSCIYINVQDY